jgi:hypothetical protein
MTLGDKITSRARSRLTAQLGPREQVLHSATVGPVGVVLTTDRLMITHPMQGVYEDINLPLSAIQNVTWKKGMLGAPGEMTVHTSSQTFTYRGRNSQGEPAVTAIRQAIAAH